MRWTTSQKVGVITGLALLYILVALVAYGLGLNVGLLR